jgi:diketogulonate reductase-like aldo/keto reductase
METKYPPGWECETDGGKKIVMDPVPLIETWRALEDLQTRGLTKYIGVCNFSCVLMMDLLAHANIKPVCNQVRNSKISSFVLL